MNLFSGENGVTILLCINEKYPVNEVFDSIAAMSNLLWEVRLRNIKHLMFASDSYVQLVFNFIVYIIVFLLLSPN